MWQWKNHVPGLSATKLEVQRQDYGNKGFFSAYRSVADPPDSMRIVSRVRGFLRFAVVMTDGSLELKLEERCTIWNL
jgi:hypothetical protein